MNPRTRGLIVFGGILFVAIVFCGIIPFVLMPQAGIGVALPVIEVPGEVVVENFLPGFNLTNTFIGTIAADIILVIFVLLAWRASRGWTKEVPNRFQALVETVIEGFYNFCKGIGGDRLRTAPMLWPLVATIFIFLLAANWMKLLPGVETVGKMHCAYEGQSGYAMHEGYWTDTSYFLYNSEPLNAGTSQTEATEILCNDYFKKKYIPTDGFNGTTVEEIEEINAIFVRLLDGLPTDADDETLEAEFETLLAGLSETEAELVGEVTYIQASHHVDDYVAERIENAELVVETRERIEAVEAQLAELEGAETAEEAVEDAEDDGETVGEEVEEAAQSEEGTETTEEVTEEVAEAEEVVAEAEATEDLSSALQEELDALEEQHNAAMTQVRYPGATVVFDEELMESGAKPYIFHITPFFRGPATDLSLTFALAIMSIVIVQAYGIWALGPAYFDKFINIPALGNLGQKPLGAIDFVVGLIEIISEIGKIVSLAFRLFGNLFAGGVALMAVSFLVAMIIPGVIYGLEVIIGAVQALVFAVLTLVFSVQAMEHHGDDHEHAEGHH
ncbi:MAG: F0F1 ATP synthase subunit A [Aggregatilineales bacterium]